MVEHFLDTEGVGGSKPLPPTMRRKGFMKKTRSFSFAFLAGVTGLLALGVGTEFSDPSNAATDISVCSVASSASTPTRVYVSNESSNDISMFQYVDQCGGFLDPISPGTIITDTTPFGIAASPDGSDIYVATYNVPAVSHYTVDPGTGALALEASHPTSGCCGYTGLTVSIDGNYLYALNVDADLIYEFSLNPSTGAMTPLSPATVTLPGGSGSQLIVPSPDGLHYYVSNLSNSTISVLSADPSGVLSIASVTSTPTPRGLAITPDGNFLYATNGFNGGGAPTGTTISAFSVNESDGALSALTPATLPVAAATGVVVSPDGRHVYVASDTSPGTIKIFDVNTATGDLVANGSVTGGDSAWDLALSPDGSKLFVIGGRSRVGDNLFTFSVDVSSGALNFMSSASAGLDPWGIVVTGSKIPVTTPTTDSAALVLKFTG